MLKLSKYYVCIMSKIKYTMNCLTQRCFFSNLQNKHEFNYYSKISEDSTNIVILLSHLAIVPFHL